MPSSGGRRPRPSVDRSTPRTREELRKYIRERRDRLGLVLDCASRHAEPNPGLSRKVEVLALAAIGLTDREMAAVLEVSQETIGTYWTRLLEDLNAASRVEAVTIVLEREIASLRPTGSESA